MSSNQSEELEKKMIRPITIANDVFSSVRKMIVQSKATEVCEFRAKIQREKTIKYSFSRRKVKNILEIGLE